VPVAEADSQRVCQSAYRVLRPLQTNCGSQDRREFVIRRSPRGLRKARKFAEYGRWIRAPLSDRHCRSADLEADAVGREELLESFRSRAAPRHDGLKHTQVLVPACGIDCYGTGSRLK